MEKAIAHREHDYWLNELNFFQDEIKFFQNKLLQIVMQNIDNAHLSLHENVNEYRSLFMQHLKEIDDLRYKIHHQEHELAHITALSESAEVEHADVKAEMGHFEENFSRLKDGFRHFVARHKG